MRIAAAILTGGKASRLGGIAKGMLVGAGIFRCLNGSSTNWRLPESMK